MLKPFIISGLAVGSLYALSGLGMLVLFRATGVLNLAYGALGAIAAMTAWEMQQRGLADWPAFAIGVGVAVVLSAAYGGLIGPLLADREPVVKAIASLGLALMILGFCLWFWNDKARTLSLPTDLSGVDVLSVRVTTTQILAVALVAVVAAFTSIYLRVTATGRAMRALADDRELSSMLGVRVRVVEALAWSVTGLLAGVSGLFLASLTALNPSLLTFLVVPALAGVVIGRLRGLWTTVLGGVVVGVIEAIGTPYSAISDYRSAAPFAVAVVVILYLQRHKTVTIGTAR